jgi:putative flippase GtrA
VRGGEGAARHQFQGLIIFGLGLALTTGALALLGHLVPDASRAVELAVIVAANAAATVLRFVLFRAWVFRPRPVTVAETPRTSENPA